MMELWCHFIQTNQIWVLQWLSHNMKLGGNKLFPKLSNTRWGHIPVNSPEKQNSDMTFALWVGMSPLLCLLWNYYFYYYMKRYCIIKKKHFKKILHFRDCKNVTCSYWKGCSDHLNSSKSFYNYILFDIMFWTQNYRQNLCDTCWSCCSQCEHRVRVTHFSSC